MVLKNRVYIARNKNVGVAVIALMDTLKGEIEKKVRSFSSVLIKANLCGGVPGEPGSHTSTAVLRVVANFFASYSVPLYIGEADCSFNDAHTVFKSLGIYQLGKETGAHVINLSSGPSVAVEVPRPHLIKTLRISALLKDSLIVSVPVLKTHPWSGITINLKNMYGAVYQKEKAVYHSGLEHNIVDINKVIMPHLCIVDASTAVVQGGFKYGLWVGAPPTELNLIIAGVNPVVVDAIGTKILGKNPLDIGHIAIADRQGLGTCDLQKIEVIDAGCASNTWPI